jgi:probable phosphoglycerate mutase
MHVWVSPCRRALGTFELLFGEIMEKESNSVTMTEGIAEWDYREYEGLLVDQIKEVYRRELRGGVSLAFVYPYKARGNLPSL